MDAGAIIDQATCRVEVGDTVDTLIERVKALEHELYPRCVSQIAASILEK